jgi:two-component system response regulator ArlR
MNSPREMPVPMKVLFIEDDVDTIVKISVIFKLYLPHEQLFFSILGEDGIRELRRGTYDLLLLSLSPPDIDGLELLRRVRQFSDIPIISLSGTSEPDEREKAICAGASYYLNRPIHYSELLVLIRAALNKRQFAAGRSTKKSLFNKHNPLYQELKLPPARLICMRLN